METFLDFKVSKSNYFLKTILQFGAVGLQFALSLILFVIYRLLTAQCELQTVLLSLQKNILCRFPRFQPFHLSMAATIMQLLSSPRIFQSMH